MFIIKHNKISRKRRYKKKTKIGREVKGIPNCWYEKNFFSTEESKKRINEINNHVLLNKRPYFFKYLYDESKKEYNDYIKFQEYRCKKTFRKPLHLLMSQTTFTQEEKKFLEDYQDFCPLIVSDSPMNLLCRHIEEIDFKIKSKIKQEKEFDFSLLKNPSVDYNDKQKQKIINQIKIFNKEYSNYLAVGSLGKKAKYNVLKEELFKIENNQDVITNIVVDYCYKDKKGNKDLVWSFFGKEVFNNLLNNCDKKIVFPFCVEGQEEGEIKYLNHYFKLGEIDYVE